MKFQIIDSFYNDQDNYSNHIKLFCRNENDSVVDKNLKVHGTENLFITGSSVFRSSGHCHPTFTIVQLSLRLADNIINYTNKI